MPRSSEGVLQPDDAGVGDGVDSLRERVEQLQRERDHLLVHSQNLEDELRHLSRQATRAREPEGSRLLQPRHALRRMYRLFRESVPWRVLKRFPGLRRKLGRFRA